MTEDMDNAVIDEIVSGIGKDDASLIPILQAIQERYNYLPEAALRRVCEITEIRAARLMGVATFYSQFRRMPAGKHFIKVCVGTACHVKGAGRIMDAVRRYVGIAEGEDTDVDRRFTVMEVACLGCCTLAPVVQIDETTYGHLTPAAVGDMVEDFLRADTQHGPRRKLGEAAGKDRDLGEIRIGQGSCCIAGGSLDVRRRLEEAVLAERLPVRVKPVGCVGMCHRTPLVEVVEPGGASTLYAKVKAEEAERIVRKHFKPSGFGGRVRRAVGSAVERLFTDEVWDPVTRYSIDVRDSQVCDYLGCQKNIAAEHCGHIDPLDMDEYVQRDGFRALREVLAAQDPDGLVATVTASGLRGRGGAGFLTGQKWSFVRQAEGDKVLVMNGDEGDPGAFMDRMLLESYPYRVLEGVVIAAYAVGASIAVLYIRQEYPLALTRVKAALVVMQERGLLGSNILESGVDLDVRIMEGAGAFVCGEETALLASIEGRRGMPRHRPPYPAQDGLWHRPTLINNVETYACVPWIVRNGGESFAGLGSGKSTGTKVFSLTGKVVRGGLIEVPMGISIRKIVEDIGGGVAEGRSFKAVQIGGPSGGCLPERLADTPVDYEALTQVGAIMGSGGLVVLDDADCMVDMARYFLQFTQEQSCGKCTFCRIGTKRMLEMLDRLTEGRGAATDVEQLAVLAEQVVEGSLCGLGKTAPNPVLTTLRYFRDEYDAHVQGSCPAKTCKALIRYTVNDDCIGCTKCAQQCPADAIAMKPYEKHEIDVKACVRCDTCRQVCPVDAVQIETG